MNLIELDEGKLVKNLVTMGDGIGGHAYLPGDKIAIANEDKLFVFDSTGREVVVANLAGKSISIITDVTNLSSNSEARKKYEGDVLICCHSDASILHCKMPPY